MSTTINGYSLRRAFERLDATQRQADMYRKMGDALAPLVVEQFDVVDVEMQRLLGMADEFDNDAEDQREAMLDRFGMDAIEAELNR